MGGTIGIGDISATRTPPGMSLLHPGGQEESQTSTGRLLLYLLLLYLLELWKGVGQSLQICRDVDYDGNNSIGCLLFFSAPLLPAFPKKVILCVLISCTAGATPIPLLSFSQEATPGIPTVTRRVKDPI